MKGHEISELVQKGVESGKRHDLKKSIHYLKKANKLSPPHPVIYYNLAFAYQQTKKFDLALRYYKKTLSLVENDTVTLLSLGSLYQTLQKNNQAIKTYEKLLSVAPDHSQALSNLGSVYVLMSKPEKAVHYLEKAIKINPGLAKANYNLANAYYLSGKTEVAIKELKKALKKNSRYGKAYNLLSSLYLEQGDTKNAIKTLKKAIQKCPEEANHVVSLANILRDTDKSFIATGLYEEAIKINPNYVETYPYLYSQLKIACDWRRLRSIEKKIDLYNQHALNYGLPPPETPFNNIARVASPKNNLEIAKAWSEKLSLSAKFFKINFNYSRLKKNGPLKIGYFSGDFQSHPVNMQLYPMYKLHHRPDFEIYAYSFGETDHSLYRTEVERGVDKFVDVAGLHHTEIAKKINDDGINILVDLMGFTRNSKPEVLALRPAPIQISYLGFSGTMGASFIDYVITDQTVTPPEEEKYYVEKFIYLPKCYQVNHPLPFLKKSLSRKDYNLPQKAFIFACFNKSAKFEPALIKSWVRILQAVPRSVLWLWLPPNNQVTRKNLTDFAKKNGVDPNRLIFAEKVPIDEHLTRLKLVDLALDTFTYSGGATTSNTLWAGVPVITLRGKHFLSRMSASIVINIGLPELVVENKGDYEQLAIGLARDPKRLSELKNKLWKLRESSDLYNLKLYRDYFEKAYKAAWKRYQKGGPAEIIQIKQ